MNPLDEAMNALEATITSPDPEKMRDALYLALTRIEQLENEIYFIKSEQADINRHITELYKRIRSRPE